MTTDVRLVPVGDRGVLVDYRAEPDADTAGRVRALDRRLGAARIDGVVEVVPAYVSALVVFDPLVTDHETVIRAVEPLVDLRTGEEPAPRRVRLPVCYDDDLGGDLGAVARSTGRSTDDVIAAHAGARYRVVMFGFAPGTGYLSGVDPAIQLPRKTEVVRRVPAGTVIIAGRQCLVLSTTMPTGWWRLGRAPARLVSTANDPPFDVGDEIEFVPISRAEYERLAGEPA